GGSGFLIRGGRGGIFGLRRACILGRAGVVFHFTGFWSKFIRLRSFLVSTRGGILRGRGCRLFSRSHLFRRRRLLRRSGCRCTSGTRSLGGGKSVACDQQRGRKQKLIPHGNSPFGPHAANSIADDAGRPVPSAVRRSARRSGALRR